jgi:dihydrofolate reductase
MNDFAMAIDKIPKIVFSRTIKNVEWKSATIAKQNLKEVVLELKQLPGKAIFVGSRSLIIQLMKLGLIDEFQLCIHPMVEGKGLPLFENINDRIIFKLVKNKIFTNGAIILYYQPKKNS